MTGPWSGAPVRATAPLRDRVGKFEISHGANVIEATVLYGWMTQTSTELPRGRVQPYVGGSPAYYILYPETI